MIDTSCMFNQTLVTADEPTSITLVDSIPPQLPHTKILDELLYKMEPVDFRQLTGLPENEKLRNNHFQIVIIEYILELAESYNWGICRNHDFIYLYNGCYWSLVDVEELKTFLGVAAERVGVDQFKAKHFSFRDQLFKQFLALANLPKPEQTSETILINLKNGTFEISPSDNFLRPFNRQDFLTYQLPFEYRPQASAPLFEKYLEEVMPDMSRQLILAEYLGYIFIRTSTLKLEKTLLLYGGGANGKSVFYEIVRHLLGEQNTSEYSLQSLTNENGYYRAMIANKLVNYASEINGKLETSRFKQLVSGEPVEARLPYGNPFTLTQYAKLIFNCNELPRDVEYTNAFFRRFLIVPFDVTIPEAKQDKQLAQKIIAKELSGIFNWVLDGLHRLLRQQGFTYNETVRVAVEQYEVESDSVKLFIQENGYKASPDSYILIKTLYIGYKNFCVEEGCIPVKKTNFRKRLSNYEMKRLGFGNVIFLAK
jgi:putative DNA primase/helicase